ncbi:HNH endonuclease family protein [Amnibacterium endophyticum]|uniref:HNH endonuclease family protein n=1 Tax=Amnibacterium endophyticum TaxID=2109337 RepID=A0ABW4LFQ9_9MICO
MRRILLSAAALVLLAGCSAAPGAAERSASAPSSPTGTSSVRALLDGLVVRPERSGAGYDRDRFGYGGDLDPDGDGCWTRREVLIRDSVVPPTIGASCRVTGEWRSAFDGRTTTDPDAFTIDHLVPLLEAWRSGAERWDPRRLVAYGNDLGYRPSLQAVTAALNEQKGNADPARWLPPRDHCGYVADWVGVKARWRLAVDPAELAAIERVLDGCGDLRIPSPGEPDLDSLT